MGFMLGFMMGMLVAFALFGVLAWWVCSRSNSVAVAKFINGIAQALAHQSRAKEPLTAGKKEEEASNGKEEKRH
jgi:hypothetical protein